MNNTGKIMTALGAGLVIGGVLGVLFAPDKGTETRKRISERGKKFTDDIKSTFRSGRNKLADMKKDVLEKADVLNGILE